MTAPPGVDLVERRGWQLVRLSSPDLEVHCLPGRGCDVLSVRPWDGPELLWSTPWGLRRQGAATGGGDDRTLLMEQYPGGWQTVFLNAGPSREAYDAPWGMHGEAWPAPFEVTASGVSADGAWLEAETRLVRSPGQHPAFASALLGPRAELSTSARRVVVDPARDTQTAPGTPAYEPSRSNQPPAGPPPENSVPPQRAARSHSQPEPHPPGLPGRRAPAADRSPGEAPAAPDER